ncbi:jg11764 [Pararge aegeria aegeria]|uniref:Jg11764 protein n=1 Tax=Pararge aegeria aegeria TaxID=348720 RepID=A0A8S4S4V5_9NEOP|nr:jg11764 [Pararge aegeria aegeria]
MELAPQLHLLTEVSSAGWSDSVGSRTSGYTNRGWFQPSKYGNEAQEQKKKQEWNRKVEQMPCSLLSLD